MSAQQETEERARPRAFNPRDHLIEIKNRGGSAEYLPVQYRLVWFREQHPQGTIETEIVQLDLDRETEEEVFAWNNDTRRSEKVVKRANGFVIFRAVVKDGKGGMATGTKSEKAASFPDYLEKCESGAIGRALAALGYGTQFAPELNEEHRIVDSPVDRTPSLSDGVRASIHSTSSTEDRSAGGPTPDGNGRKPLVSVSVTPPTEQKSPDARATEQQLTSIRKLCHSLGKPEPENQETMTYQSARELIQRLSIDYRQSRKAS